MRISLGACALAMSAVLVLGPTMALSDGYKPCPVKVIKEFKPKCFHGASGNEVDCDKPGNHVVVTKKVVQIQKRDGKECKPHGDPKKTCDISRAKGQGATQPFVDVYCSPS